MCIYICNNKDITLAQHKTYGSTAKYASMFSHTFTYLLMHSSANISLEPEISGFENLIFNFRDHERNSGLLSNMELIKVCNKVF